MNFLCRIHYGYGLHVCMFLYIDRSIIFVLLRLYLCEFPYSQNLHVTKIWIECTKMLCLIWEGQSKFGNTHILLQIQIHRQRIQKDPIINFIFCYVAKIASNIFFPSSIYTQFAIISMWYFSFFLLNKFSKMSKILFLLCHDLVLSVDW